MRAGQPFPSGTLVVMADQRARLDASGTPLLDTTGADAVVVSGIARNGVAGPRSSLRLAAWTALPAFTTVP